jgi:hypothetical protein
MGMQLGIKNEQYLPTEDHSWLGSRHGAEAPDGVTLDAATCGALFTDGRVPSGLLIQKITATGLYGPLDIAAADGRQLITQAAMQDVRVLWMTADLGSGRVMGQSFVNTGGSVLWQCQLISAKLPRQTGAGSLVQTGVLTAMQSHAQRYTIV